jgi:hypothetical protein
VLAAACSLAAVTVEVVATSVFVADVMAARLVDVLFLTATTGAFGVTGVAGGVAAAVTVTTGAAETTAGIEFTAATTTDAALTTGGAAIGLTVAVATGADARATGFVAAALCCVAASVLWNVVTATRFDLFRATFDDVDTTLAV